MRSTSKSFIALFFFFLLMLSCQSPEITPLTDEVEIKNFVIERAKYFEYDPPVVLPPGDAQVHHASGFAKILCSAVFVTGLDFDFAAEAL
jgi:hypothetical protein